MRTFGSAIGPIWISTGVKIMPTKYVLKCVIALICGFILTACENNKQPQLVTTVTPLDSFQLSGGIERISLSHPLVNSVYHIYSKNLESKFLIPDVRSELDNLPENGTVVSTINSEINPSVVSANRYRGNVMLGEQGVDIRSYTSVNKSARVYFASNDSGLLDIMTYGPRISGALPTGVTSYSGANLLTVNHGEVIYEGEFKLDINFDDGKGFLIDENQYFSNDAIVEIQGSNNFNYVRLAGTFKVNIPSGTFSGNDMTLQFCVIERCRQDEYSDDVTETRKASLHGSLHGEDANGIAGIYYDNEEDSPTYIGALIGTDGLRSSN